MVFVKDRSLVCKPVQCRIARSAVSWLLSLGGGLDETRKSQWGHVVKLNGKGEEGKRTGGRRGDESEMWKGKAEL